MTDCNLPHDVRAAAPSAEPVRYEVRDRDNYRWDTVNTLGDAEQMVAGCDRLLKHRAPFAIVPLYASPAPQVAALSFLTACDGDRVWCVRCKGWKQADGEYDPCPDDTPDGACPIQEGDESKWAAVTSEQAQEAIDALAKEMSDLDDSAAGMLNERDAQVAALREESK